MKRFLSILLSVLMVMSTMSMVAFAEDTIAFAPVMDLDSADIVKAGSKIMFTVEAADGATVTYYNNGTEVTPDVVVADVAEDGEFTQTVALPTNVGKNVFHAATGNTVSEKYTVNAVAYVFEKNFYDEADVKATTALFTAVTSEENTTYPSASINNIGGRNDVFMADKSARFADGNTLASDITEITVDFYLDSETFNPTYSSSSILGFYTTNSYNGSDVQATALNSLVFASKSVDDIGYSTVTALADGTTYPTKTSVRLYDMRDNWHNLTYYLNSTTGYCDVYIDGMLVVKNQYLGVHKVSGSYVDSTYKRVRCLWFTNNPGIYFDNFEMNAVGSTSIATYPVSGDVPDGAKAAVIAKHLSAGQSVVAYVDGKATTLGNTDGTYNIDIPDGYSSVSAAILNADGTVATNANGIAQKLNESVFYGDTFNGKAEQAKTDFGSITYTDISDVSTYTNLPASFKLFATNGKSYLSSTSGVNNTAAWIITGWGNINAYPYATGTAAADGSAHTLGFDIVFSTPQIIEYTYSAKYESLIAGDSIENAMSKMADTYPYLFKYNITSSDFNEGTRTEIPIIVFNKTTQKPAAVKYSATGSITGSKGEKYDLIDIDVDMAEWHTYSAVLNSIDATLTVLVDGAVVSVSPIVVDADGAAAASSISKIDAAYITLPRWYKDTTPNDTRDKHAMSIYVDDAVCNAYSAAAEKNEDAFVNKTADGIGLVPANLDAEDKVADMAIIARAADGSVQVQKYNALTSTDTYKYFTFTKPAKDIFIWNWETLKPLEIPFTPAQ